MRASRPCSGCQRTSQSSLRAISFAGFLIARTLIAAAQQTPDSFNLYTEAVGDIRAGNFADACVKARRLVDLDPKSPFGYNLQGLCVTQEGDTQKAEGFFHKSIALAPRFVDARNNLALQLTARGQYQTAMSEFQHVLLLEPANVTALYNLARIELTTGRVNSAVTHLRMAFSLVPDDANIGLTLAEALRRSKHLGPTAEVLRGLIEKTEESGLLLTAAVLAKKANCDDLARNAIKKAIAVDPQVPEKIIALARVASSQKDYPVVAFVLGSLETTTSSSAEWNALEGYAYYKQGQPEKALPKLQRALELDPRNEDYYMKMGELMLYYKSQQPAISYFQAGLHAVPDSATLHYGLAVSYLGPKFMGEQAAQELETALQLKPGFDEARTLYCMVLYQLKDPRLNAAAEELMKLRPVLSEGYYYKALALQEQSSEEDGTKEQITALFRRAIQLKPTFQSAYVEFGKFLNARGNSREAIGVLQKAAALDPNDPAPIYQLVRAYQKTGQLNRSREASQLFNKMDPQQPTKWEELFQLTK
jgi:tetratricopeptide (TPR) repeat protein